MECAARSPARAAQPGGETLTSRRVRRVRRRRGPGTSSETTRSSRCQVRGITREATVDRGSASATNVLLRRLVRQCRTTTLSQEPPRLRPRRPASRCLVGLNRRCRRRRRRRPLSPPAAAAAAATVPCPLRSCQPPPPACLHHGVEQGGAPELQQRARAMHRGPAREARGGEPHYPARRGGEGEDPEGADAADGAAVEA